MDGVMAFSMKSDRHSFTITHSITEASQVEKDDYNIQHESSEIDSRPVQFEAGAVTVLASPQSSGADGEGCSGHADFDGK